MLNILHLETDYKTLEADALVQDTVTGDLKILPWSGYGPEVLIPLWENKE